MGMLAGLTGDAPAIRHHVAECQRVADEIHSPIHRVRAAEVAVELMSNTGEWDAALALAERTLAEARALGQRTILARLLVWTGLIYLGRGDLERGRGYVDEAWEISGAGDPEHPLDVHTVVPAHAGRAAYHIAAGEMAEAVRVAERGLVVADRTGYTVWAMHRLLPIMAEAYLSMGDVEGATRVGARLRADAERLGHDLGIGWADACDAFLVWLRGDIDGAIGCMRAAAERLESVPVLPAAARLRRHFAARLRDSGRTDEALRELRQVHEVFARIGAERELAKTREQLRELGVRPPARGESGSGGLTSREAEIARLVAARQSNKTIARTLAISPRTVTTHLSNIFRKLEIGSRGELVDVVRQGLVRED
jgi:DNA-binding CsgD family transcriptional regulator